MAVPWPKVRLSLCQRLERAAGASVAWPRRYSPEVWPGLGPRFSIANYVDNRNRARNSSAGSSEASKKRQREIIEIVSLM